MRLLTRTQAWESDKLKDDWELERTVDGGRGGRRTVNLQGAGGIVNSMVASVLGDLMQPLPPCSAAECHELSDDAALEVRSPRHISSLCMYMYRHIAVCLRAFVAVIAGFLFIVFGRRCLWLPRPWTCCSCCNRPYILKATLPPLLPRPEPESSFI